MIDFFGNFCLSIALGMSLIQTLGIVPNHIARLARPACQTSTLFIISAFGTLFYALITYDTSLKIVWENVGNNFSLIERLASLWQQHSGIMMLWATFFSIFSSLYIVVTRKNTPDTLSRPVIGVLGFFQVGLVLYLLLFVSPFVKGTAPPQALVLKTASLTWHHPILYMSYMLIAIVYALVMGVLLEGKRVATLSRTAQPWVLAAWGALFLGIFVGLLLKKNNLGSALDGWTKIDKASYVTFILLTILVPLLKFAEQNRFMKKVGFFVGILVFYQTIIGNLKIQPVSLANMDLLIVNDPKSKFLFLFLFVSISFCTMLYVSRILRSIRKPAEEND